MTDSRRAQKRRWRANANRREPYTPLGIRRVPCVRCGQPGYADWGVCADANRRRVLCVDCDIELNRMVLTWAGDPNVERKMRDYETVVRVEDEARASVGTGRRNAMTGRATP